MKLLIYLAVWKRPEITEICFMGITRLMGLFPIQALAVISEESMIPLCEKYDIQHCFYKNLPLGEKLNYGLSEALKLDWDYVLCIGSDDLVKNELLNLYSGFFGKKDWIALDNMLFLNSENGRCRWITENSSFGAGRCFSRKLVEDNPELWPSDRNRKLDNGLYSKFLHQGIMETRVKSEKPLIIDIKSSESIGYFPAFGEKIPFDLVIQGLSEQEIKGLKSLQCVAV